MAERLARSHVGYFAWDVVHATEKVPDWPGVTGPLARFFGGATTIVFDNLAQTLTIAAHDAADVERAAEDLGGTAKLRHVAVPDRARIPSDFEVSIDDARFMTMVERAKDYIAAGDAFQIVLARTFSVPQGGRDPFDVYRAMRVINPSPYMYFVDMPATPGDGSEPGGAGTQILGASPETLVRLEGEGALKKMTVRPLAGTRPRGRTPREDELRASELLADPKERAEHVMLIDLGRNDVGRVANVGTVRLPRRMEIERYSHVMHLVSEVEGDVDTARISPFEVLRAAFPAGTLSGAPKLRAMQIIRELEAGPRGVYGGAVGYFADTGDLDLAIAIRTAVCKDGRFEVTAGAGVVEASVPEHEVAETRNKAKAVLASIEAATR
jgi:anthranilate synthase component 1